MVNKEITGKPSDITKQINTKLGRYITIMTLIVSMCKTSAPKKKSYKQQFSMTNENLLADNKELTVMIFTDLFLSTFWLQLIDSCHGGLSYQTDRNKISGSQWDRYVVQVFL